MEISIIPTHPNIFNFQKCIISGSLSAELEEKYGKFYESFFSIQQTRHLHNFIVRCCREDVADVVHVDCRVTEIIPRMPHQLARALSHGESVTIKNGGETGDGSGIHIAPVVDEMDLGRLLKEKMNEGRLKSCAFDVDEESVESSMRFNDALCCTSKDIKMLKSGTIKMMRLTVISSAPLSDFLYETNHEMRGGYGSSSKFKNLSFHQEKRETAGNGGRGVLLPRWNVLRDKIRQIFQSYEIHLKRNCLVDFRSCPLSSVSMVGSPSISFVFVEEAEFRQEADVGKVASKTEIVVSNVSHISYYLKGLGKEEGRRPSFQFFGVENGEKVLTSLIEMQKRGCGEIEQGNCLLDNFHSHGLLIAGPSGCGKCLVVRETVKKLRGNLVVFNPIGTLGQGSRSNLKSVGDAWTDVFIESVQSSLIQPTVLLIPKVDECLLIKGQNKGGRGGSGGKLLNHVCNLFDSIPQNAKLTVVGTSSKPFLIPAKLRRAGRLEREVYIGAPTEEQRLNILKSLSHRVGASFNKLDLGSVARKTPGYVGQDLIRLAHLAILKSYEENSMEVDDSHIKYALSRILPSVLQGTLGVVGIHRPTSLDNIAGLHSVKHDLIKAIVWPLKYPQAFRTMGITPPKGILLYSPPGCAKTTLVRAVAASHQTNFLSVSAAELFSSSVGDSEKIVADLFHRARMASPCILFIDELEAIVGSRQMSPKKEKTTNESILSMLLTEMDGVGTQSPCGTDRTLKTDDNNYFGPLVLVVAATNRIDMIDSALIRPGRFDKLIYVSPLDEKGRVELLQICAKTTPFNKDVDFKEIAEATHGYSGADIVNLCREAALLALSENMDSNCVSTENVLHALSMLSPSLTKTL